jgi:hypothetical protein
MALCSVKQSTVKTSPLSLYQRKQTITERNDAERIQRSHVTLRKQITAGLQQWKVYVALRIKKK